MEKAGIELTQTEAVAVSQAVVMEEIFVTPSWAKRFFAALGPGLISGAADDDPSGIATYSIAGAQLGTSLLWTALVTWPMMAAVQMMCARIGMVTEQGLAGALRQKLPKPLIVIFSIALLIANTINIAADLAGMADAANLLTGIGAHLYVIFFGVAIAYAIVPLPLSPDRRRAQMDDSFAVRLCDYGIYRSSRLVVDRAPDLFVFHAGW